MIRRDLPRGEANNRWVLISQVEHARLSHALASKWTGLLDDAPSQVKDECLAAILHHDDGWIEWEQAPEIDPEHGRPYGFTEMPPESAQRVWTGSIDRCAELGPLAAWMVASHFIDLQSKQDDDFPEWARWLGEQDRRRAGWLREWTSVDPAHAAELAESCLGLLQTFDWLSLWLCCVAPMSSAEQHETLELGGGDTGFGPYLFTPDKVWPTKAEAPLIEVEPWPFAESNEWFNVNATSAPAHRYLSYREVEEESSPYPCYWSLYHPYSQSKDA